MLVLYSTLYMPAALEAPPGSVHAPARVSILYPETSRMIPSNSFSRSVRDDCPSGLFFMPMVTSLPEKVGASDRSTEPRVFCGVLLVTNILVGSKLDWSTGPSNDSTSRGLSNCMSSTAEEMSDVWPSAREREKDALVPSALLAASRIRVASSVTEPVASEPAPAPENVRVCVSVVPPDSVDMVRAVTIRADA